MNKESIIERQANESLKLANDNYNLQQRIEKAIEILSEDFTKCPRSLTFEKSYIIEQNKIEKALNILKGKDNE